MKLEHTTHEPWTQCLLCQAIDMVNDTNRPKTLPAWDDPEGPDEWPVDGEQACATAKEQP